MNLNVNTTLALLLVFSFLLTGCFALETPEESSGEVAAPTLAPVAEDEPIEAQVATEQPAEAPTEAPTPAEVAEAYPGNQPMAQPAPTELPANYPGEDAAEGDITGDSAVYEIDPAQSEARFTINEVLRGTPTTVVGVTNNLGGQIALDLNNPGAAQIGTILVNARDLRTDNDFRNNAIANEILLTNNYEFITFEPRSISGLPQTAEIGQTYDLQVTGDLTITDQTREVTFDTQVTPTSENELRGLATLEILYADYGLTIPFARSVESVEDTVILELEFVATR